jgi:hypothetical protein
MLRNFIIIAALTIVYLILRARLRQNKSRRAHKAPSRSTRMVQCLSCGTYVPVEQAVFDGDNQFCCQQHLRDWASKT